MWRWAVESGKVVIWVVDGFTEGRGGREDVLDGAPTDVAVEVEAMAGVEDVPGASPMAGRPELEADVDDIEAGPIEVCWIDGIVVCPPPELEPIEDPDKEGTSP
jgi:hypothetical protein